VDLSRDLMFDWPLMDGEVDLSVPELNLVGEPDGSMRGSLIYNARAFGEHTIARLAEHLLGVLDVASTRPKESLRALTDKLRPA